MEEHNTILATILRKLSGAKLKVCGDKFKVGVNEIKFLGYNISRKGIRTIETKFKTIILHAHEPKYKQ